MISHLFQVHSRTQLKSLNTDTAYASPCPSSSPSVLLTGGTSRTSLRLAKLLAAQNVPVIIASPSHSKSTAVPAPFKGVKFDFTDPSTYDNPFNVDTASGSPRSPRSPMGTDGDSRVKSNIIDRVYLVAPPNIDMLPFVGFAMRKGVKRFVVLSTMVNEAGGETHKKLRQFLGRGEVEWCVLRPSLVFGTLLSFKCVPQLIQSMVSFADGWMHFHSQSIRRINSFFSATGDGKIGFVSSDDVIDVAVMALLDDQSHNTDHFIVGPQLLSFDDVSKIMSKVLGHKVVHEALSMETYKTRLESGVPGLCKPTVSRWVKLLLRLHGRIAEGREVDRYRSSKTIVGQRFFKDWLEENRGIFLS
jgi:festuclavine dehydrogenase